MTTITDTTATPANSSTLAGVEIKDGVDTNAFRPYDSQLSIPTLSGFRTVKCLYKVAKTGKNAGKPAGENSYIRISDGITSESVTEKLGELMPYIVSYLQEQEAGLVKKLHVAGMTVLSPKQYGLDMIISSLESAGAGQRLNKEQIDSWFMSEMEDSLATAFADKLGMSEEPTDEELQKLDGILGVYKAKFGSLASGKTHYRSEEADMLLKVIDVTGAGDSALGVRFISRLEKMKSSTSESLLASL